MTVFRLEGAPRGSNHALVTEGADGWLISAAVQMLHEVERHQRLQHRDLDELPLAGAFLVEERGGDGLAHGEPDDLVGDRGRHVPSFPILATKEAGEAGGGLYCVVVCRLGPVRTVLSEAVRPNVDDVLLERGHPLIVEAEASDGLGAHVVDEDIRCRYQLLQRILRTVLLQIERDGSFVPVDIEIDAAHPRITNRTHVAGDIAGRWPFHLDDVGTHVAEDLGGVGTEQDGRDVDNANAAEWTRQGSLPHRSWFVAILPCSPAGWQCHN